MSDRTYDHMITGLTLTELGHISRTLTRARKVFPVHSYYRPPITLVDEIEKQFRRAWEMDRAARRAVREAERKPVSTLAGDSIWD